MAKTQKFFDGNGNEPQMDNPMLALLTGVVSDDEQTTIRRSQAPGRTVYTDDPELIEKVQKDHAAAVRKANREGEPIPAEPMVLPPVTITVSGVVNKSVDHEGMIAQRVRWDLFAMSLLSRVNTQTGEAVTRQMVTATLEAVRDPNNISASEQALMESMKPIIVPVIERVMAATRGTISGTTRISQVSVQLHEPAEAMIG